MVWWGMPYMGSKNDIADELCDVLPKGKRFVDLFGGGAAMTHCASQRAKWQEFYYNELNPIAVDLLRKSVSGEIFKNKPEWITRDKFKQLKDTDGMISFVWSFGNKGMNYLYSKEVEPWKRALHYARVFGDYTKLAEFGINSDGSRADIVKHHEEYKQKYIIWYCKNILKSNLDTLELQKHLNEKIEQNSERLREYLRDGLKKAGKTSAQVDKYLGTNGMAGHYFGKSQWEFPTREVYIKLQDFIDLPIDYDEIYGLQELMQRLQRLQSLQSLQRLQSLQSLEINCGSYLDYQYKDGDVVYCDPPYEGTAEYSNGAFDSKQFYDWVASRPYRVYFSSYEITDERFYVVWERVRCAKLSATTNSTHRVEKLYCNHPVKTMLNEKQLDLFEDFSKGAA